jgi:hypothetical protein
MLICSGTPGAGGASRKPPYGLGATSPQTRGSYCSNWRRTESSDRLETDILCKWPFGGPGPCAPRSERVGESGHRAAEEDVSEHLALTAGQAVGVNRLCGAADCARPRRGAGSWRRSGSCPRTRRRSTPSSRKRAHLCFRSRPLQDCATAIDAELRTVGYWNSQPGLEMRQRQSL